jgi:transcriptional regulator of acetoin/glycerol metabolism
VTRLPMPRDKTRPPSQRAVAVSRERFLTAEAPEPRSVRDTILASWQRSQELQVAADHIEMSFEADLHLDTRLSRSAMPILRNLREHLYGQSVSVILTDQTGLVLSRLTGDRDLERHLDKVLLAPGFSYAEKFVGTNGIGTALEMGGPAHVFGHEHYAENLEDLACAGVPILHPISGRLVGAVDLTCWRKDAGSLLLTLAKATAEQIRQALLTDTGASELGLLKEYLRTCSRRTGIVFALSDEVVMLNDYTRTVLDPRDQEALLAQTNSARARGDDPTFAFDLPSGKTAHVYCRTVRTEDHRAGVVAHVKVEDAPRLDSLPRDPRPWAPLPGLVGSGPSWVHACHEVERVFRSGEWLALEGEAGVGKLALLRAVQLRRQPVGRLVVLEADDAATDPEWHVNARRSILEGADCVIVRHVDHFDGTGLRTLSSTLQAARDAALDKPIWVAVTLVGQVRGKELSRLLQLFPSSIEVPPLRMHREDLEPLVTLFLSRLSQGGHLVCTPEAMRLLMRMDLPRNAEQVHELLGEVVKRRRTGSISPEDLPPEVHSVSRRVLTSMESLSRDAIVRALADANGDKVRAARALGMSRATIYRKIHDYGIVVPSS